MRTNRRRVVDLTARTSALLLLTMALSTFGGAPAVLAAPIAAHHHAARHHRAHGRRAKLIQPLGASFKAAFPTPPVTDADDATAVRHFPGAVSATAYWVSPKTAILGPGTPLPPAPTYFLAIGKFPTQAAAERFTAALRQVPGVHPATIGHLHGDQFLGHEASAINKGYAVTQPHDWDSETALRRGLTVYLSIAYTTNRAAAMAFTHSLRPAATHNALPAQPTPSSGGGQGHIDRLIGEIAVAVIVIAGLSILVNKARASSGGSTPRTKRRTTKGPPTKGKRAAKHGGGSGGASATTSTAQFGWLHQQPAQPDQMARTHPALGEESAAASTPAGVDPYAPLAVSRTVAPQPPPAPVEPPSQGSTQPALEQLPAPVAAEEPLWPISSSVDVLPASS